MRFSVIVPVYNVEKYLKTCIESVINQTYTDFELILVDDGSKDTSGGICDYFEKTDQRIKVFHKKNEGQISARRKGLCKAEGEYIIFIDSDDFIKKDMLQQLESIIQRFSPDVLMYQWQIVNNEGQLLKESSSLPFSQGLVDKDEIIKLALASSKLNSLCIKACKRELFDIANDYSKYFSIQKAEDLLQFIPVLQKAETFYYLPKAFYCYRINPTSITHKVKKSQFKNLDIVRPKLFRMVDDLGKMTNENMQSYFSFYLECIYSSIQQVCTSELYDKESVLREIRCYENVGNAKKFLSYSRIWFYKKIILNLFFQNKFSLTIFIFQTFFGRNQK